MALTITDWQIIGEGEAEGWMVSGYVDPNATQVRIRRVAGPELLASVGGGRFVAFWIGPSDVSSMTAFDRTGREIARIDDPMELGGGVPPSPRRSSWPPSCVDIEDLARGTIGR